MSCYETAKLWGYLDREEVKAWHLLMQSLAEQNPTVERFEAHFYCTDTQFPYYFSYEVDEGRLRLFKGSNYHVAYFRAREGVEGPEYQFDVELYKLAYHRYLEEHTLNCMSDMLSRFY